MLSRRKFLKTGLTTGAAAIPLASVLDAAQQPDQHAANSAPKIPAYQMIAMPARLAQSPAASEPWQNRVRRVGQTNMTEHDPAVMNVEEWADYWHSCKVDVVFVSVTGILAFYPSKVPFHRHGKFLNGRDFFGECAAGGKETRHARGGAHESRPELGRCTRGAPGVGDAPQGRLCAVQHGGAAALQDLHVLHLHGRLRAGRDARDQFALRSRLLLHQRMAADRHAARVFLRGVQQTAGQRYTGLLARLQRSRAGFVEALRRNREREEGRQFLLCQFGRERARQREPRPIGQNHRVVPGRQPGTHLRRSRGVGMQPAGPRVQRCDGWKICRQRDGSLLHRDSRMAQFVQVSGRNAHVVQRNAGQRHGALQPFRRRGKGILRGSPLAESGRGVF